MFEIARFKFLLKLISISIMTFSVRALKFGSIICCFFNECTRGRLTSLTLPLFIEVPIPRQESDRSCICVLVISIFPLSTILIFYFGIVVTACFLFHFIWWLVTTFNIIGKQHFYFKVSGEAFGILCSTIVTFCALNITFYQRTLLGTSANQKRYYLKLYNNTICFAQYLIPTVWWPIYSGLP